MQSAIIINLDYERHTVQTCHRVWEEISLGMRTAGFDRHLRLFLAEMDRKAACARAKRVVSEVEDKLTPEGIIVFDVIREFYWFEYQAAVNDLLAPSNEMPEVSFLDAGALHAFLYPDNR